MNKIISLIPARGGSKGLPRKNIISLSGQPLISFTIKSSQAVKRINEVYTSTDDPEISEVAQKYNSKVIPRPKYLALDHSSTDSVINHAIEYLKLNKGDIIILLQATSPLRTQQHIEQALDLFIQKQPKILMSVYKPKECIFKGYKRTKNGYLQAIFNPDDPFKPRQEFEDVLFANGAIYIFKVEHFLEKKLIPRSNIFPFIMEQQDSVDIDQNSDLTYCEFLHTSKI